MGKKLTKEEFINRAKEIHGDKYDYSKVNYVNKRTKIEIICPIHGSFFQYPEVHIRGSGCPECGKKISKEKRKLTNEEIIEQFKKVHGNKYDYSKVNYVNIDTPVEIICPIHGSFFQSPYEHKNGANCPKCSGKEKNTEKFIEEVKEIHGDKYDYSKVNYINAKEPVEIICPIHGAFLQPPNRHLFGSGCPKCNSSKGEIKIRNFLIKNNIPFEEQKRFEDCKDKRALPFDFFLQDSNMLIEYDGIQHFAPIDFSGTNDEKMIKNFNLIKNHDEIKNNYCASNNINLLRIPYYKENDIEDVLDENINTKNKTGTFIIHWDASFDKEAYAKSILDSLGDFPFDCYSDKELLNDFNNIATNPNSIRGLKVVKHFHHNIYTSKRSNNISPFEAWQNKNILYKTILNRMKYRKPPYTPKVIRDGLNISKVAPKVSVFKPSLAAYLIDKYLNEFDTIFDPFSGFSGRMLGACSLGKKYIGQDISQEMIDDSTNIKKYFNLNADLTCKDIMQSGGDYDCLFTCSPYSNKEQWEENLINKTCDEWIDECLNRFNCKTYLFVVDNTSKYNKYIVGEITNKSHMSNNKEHIILINKE